MGWRTLIRDDSESRWKQAGDHEITRRHRGKCRRRENSALFSLVVAARMLQPQETARGEINGVHRHEIRVGLRRCSSE